MAGRACGTEKRESGRRKEELMGAAQLEVRKREKGGGAGRAACWPGVWATRKEEERGGRRAGPDWREEKQRSEIWAGPKKKR